MPPALPLMVAERGMTTMAPTRLLATMAKREAIFREQVLPRTSLEGQTSRGWRWGEVGAVDGGV